MSALSLLLVTFDRYVAIVHPYHYARNGALPHLRLILTGVWLYSIMFAIVIITWSRWPVSCNPDTLIPACKPTTAVKKSTVKSGSSVFILWGVLYSVLLAVRIVCDLRWQCGYGGHVWAYLQSSGQAGGATICRRAASGHAPASQCTRPVSLHQWSIREEVSWGR